MDQYNVYDVAEKIFAAIQKEREGMTHMNVMVMGKTGSGKSTLINNMFNEKLADTSQQSILPAKKQNQLLDTFLN